MNIYLFIVLLVLIGSTLLNLFVNRLNLRHIQTELPGEFQGYYDPERYRKSQRYLRETSRLDMISDGVSTVLTVAFILLGGFDLVDRIARGFGLGSIVTGLLFVGLLLLVSQLVQIPFSAYATFVVEAAYGFNRTSLKTFISDIIKGWLLTALLGGSIFALLLWLFEAMGPGAWMFCWAAVTIFQVVLLFLAPVLIMPLFNKFDPLAPGELKSALERYARAQNFRIKGVYTMDGSKRSTKSNAFFTGFGRFRRIVLFDTLVDRHTTDELLCVVGHEIGHYKNRHIVQHLLISITTTAAMFFILSFFLNNRGLFEAFKMQYISVYAGLVFFGFLYSPIAMIIGVLSGMLSRRNEYEADRFALTTLARPDALVSALKKLSVDNLSNLTPHPLKVFLAYSHPPVLARIKRIRELSKRLPVTAPGTPAGPSGQ